MNPLKNNQIRSCYDKTSNKRWFSVVDVCAALRNCNYATARNYWKWLKRKLEFEKNQPVSEYRQLKMQAADGKLRDTDVMDAQEILQLIQHFPSQKANEVKLWIIYLATKGKDVVNYIDEALKQAKDSVRCKTGNLLKTIRRKRFKILEDEVHFHSEGLLEAA